MFSIKKIGTGFFLVFLILSFSSISFAQYIVLNDDGWSDPSVGEWNPATKTGVLTQDLSGTVIEIIGEGITLDGSGHTMTGNGVEDDKIDGIRIIEQSGVTVKNLIINNFKNGIILVSSDNANIENVNSSNNGWGITLESSSNNTLTGNTTNSNSRHGIVLNNSSSNNTLSGNTVNSNSRNGILLDNSSNNTLTGNTVNSNSFHGIFLRNSSNNNTLLNNTCMNSGYGIRIYSSSGNNLTGNTANLNRQYGINFNLSNDNSLSDNTISDNFWGILLMGANNTLTGNSMSGNTYNFTMWGGPIQTIDKSNTVDGKPIYFLVDVSDAVIDASTNAGFVYVANGTNVTVKDLTLTNNGMGVWFENTINSLIENVTVSNNLNGIQLSNSTNNTVTGNTVHASLSSGIQLITSDCNNITGNAVSENGKGIVLGSYSASKPDFVANDNNITGNIVCNNKVGVSVGDFSSNNEIYHNSFIDNEIQAYDQNMPGTVNFFNLDMPTGGNYWNDWTSPDSDGDGIVDEPYVFDGGQDNLPWTTFNGWMTSEQAIESLIADVQDLGLNKGNTNALVKKLENAIKSLKKGKNNAAANKINAFINQVNAFIANGKISSDEGQLLIYKASSIIERINGGLAKQGVKLPGDYVLEQNYPNPFNPTTTIRFQLPQSFYVTLNIYSTNGSLVKTLVSETMSAGYYSLTWDGMNDTGQLVSSGIYIYKIRAGGFSAIKKMAFIK